MTEAFDISQFNEYREDNRLEVKRAKDGLPDALWETYSAFANTGGGCIIRGVKERDDKSWVTTGLKNVTKLRNDFFNLQHNQNKVSIALVGDTNVRDYEYDGDVILVIEVPKARREDKPVYINGDMWNGTYCRDGEGDYHCSRQAVLAMLRDQTENTPDMKILENKEIKDFDQTSVRSYRKRYDTAHQGHPWCDLTDEDFLVRIGAASDETSDRRTHPTAAGLLMFGVYQRIMWEFPNFLLDYYEKTNPALRWTDRLASHNGDWSGNVYDFYNKVYMKIAVDLKKPFKLDGMYRIDDTPVHVAVREALANCLVNADYFLPDCVKVEKYPDKLVFSNPGTIRIGKKQMLHGGKSSPRNKVLLNMFNLIGVGERAGSGVPNIYSIWQNENYQEPTVEELSGREGTICTVVTLPLAEMGTVSQISGKSTKKSAKKTAKQDEIDQRMEAVLQAIASDPLIKNAELEEKLGITKGQIDLVLKRLQDDKRIHREDGNRKGKWIIDGAGN